MVFGYKKLKKDEKVLANFNNIVTFFNDNQVMTDILLVTNDRFIFMRDINKDADLVNMFRARGMGIVEEFELFYEIILSDIKNILCKEDMNQIVLSNSDNIVDIFCDDLNKYML